MTSFEEQFPSLKEIDFDILECELLTPSFDCSKLNVEEFKNFLMGYCLDKAKVREAIEFLIDPEVISYNCDTQEKRMAVTNYVRNWSNVFKKKWGL
jgi:hypothetical protein